MLISEAVTKVRSATLHDDDTQFTDTQLIDVLADEYRRHRLWLCTYVPELCETVVSGIAVTSSGVILKSALANFEKLRRVERLEGANYYPIYVAQDFEASTPNRRCVREQPLQLLISPSSMADGTYQVVYSAGAPASIVSGTTIDLPPILCNVLVESGCLWVCSRHDSDQGRIPYHQKRHDALMDEARSELRSRYGDHGKSGLRRERRWR